MNDTEYVFIAILTISVAMFTWYVAWWLSAAPKNVSDLCKRSFWLIGVAGMLITCIFITIGHRVGAL